MAEKKTEKYQALTTCCPAPGAKFPRRFQTGDVLDLPADEAKALLAAGAVKPLGGSVPKGVQVPDKKNAEES